jgi:phosphopantetheinyl transferase
VEERHTLANKRSALAQREFLAARYAERRCVASILGFAPERLHFVRASNGKPRVLGQPNVHYSLAHSNGVVVCTVAHEPVGIDIEPLARGTELATIVDEFATPAESTRAPPDAPLVRLWTIKEAVSKVYGGGLASGLANIDVSFHGPMQFSASLGPHCYTGYSHRLDDFMVAACIATASRENEQ